MSLSQPLIYVETTTQGICPRIFPAKCVKLPDNDAFMFGQIDDYPTRPRTMVVLISLCKEKCAGKNHEMCLLEFEALGELGDLTPSWASCSKKSDQSSANDSFLVPLSGKKSVDNAGVLGVRCQGDTGTLKLGFDAPGRARPACSLCSTEF